MTVSTQIRQLFGEIKMHLKIQPKVILHNVVGLLRKLERLLRPIGGSAKIVRVSFLENRRPSGITDVRQGVRSVESLV